VIDESLANDQILSEESPEAWGFTDWTMMSEKILAAASAPQRRRLGDRAA
jgi:hypothetical protein